MTSPRRHHTAPLVFLIALLTRLVGIGVTIFTDLNTYAQGDVRAFSFTARYVADSLSQGVYSLPKEPATWATRAIETWGTALAPFWLLPGPSRIYARLGVGVLGAYAIYNVYLIARSVADRNAALIAVAPMILYPSFVFVHSSILRESAILFGITTAARLLIVPPRQLNPLVTYITAGGFLWFASIFRLENRFIFAAVLLIAIAVKYRDLALKTAFRYVAPVVCGSAGVLGLILLRRNIRFLADLRKARARGRTAYLGEVVPESLASVVAFSWLGAIYFLFTPFPWMVAQLADFVAVFEALGNLVFAIFALTGVRTVFHRNPTVAVSLAAGIVLGAVLYGLATANVGTAIRHRQMLLWAIFIFGGIGMAEHFDFTLSSDWWSTNHSELLDDGQSGTPADD